MTHKFMFVLATAALAAACSTQPAAETASAKPDPRQGAELNQVCFSQQIKNWRVNKGDRRSVIVQKGTKDEYKLNLIGACQPEDAFLNIGLISRAGGGSCLSQGDKLVTDVRYASGDCSITKIYQWNEDAGKPAAG